MTTAKATAPGGLASPAGSSVRWNSALGTRAQVARRARRRKSLEFTLAWLVPVVFVGAWQVVSKAGWVNQQFFPAPSTVWDTGIDMARSGVLWDNLSISLTRVLLGFVIGSVTGSAVGLAMGVSSLLRAALDPMLTALYMVPKLALLPLLLLIFGLGETPLVIQISITTFFFMWLSTMAAFASVPEGYREVARSFHANPWQQFRHVLLPAALPEVFVGLRLTIGVAVLVMVGIEFVQAPSGIGWLIWNSWQLFLAPQMYVGIVVVSVVGVILTWAIRGLGYLAMPWERHTGKKARF